MWVGFRGFYLEFYGVEFEFGSNSNSSYIQTEIYMQNYLQKLTSNMGRHSATEVLQRPLNPSTLNRIVGVLDRQTYQGGTRGSRLCGGDRDRETENSKVCARTRDTRFIQVRAPKVANPTSCLGNQVWRPALGVGWDQVRCPARYPALLYIVQGAGS
jgi:hypothetical protein